MGRPGSISTTRFMAVIVLTAAISAVTTRLLTTAPAAPPSPQSTQAQGASPAQETTAVMEKSSPPRSPRPGGRSTQAPPGNDPLASVNILISNQKAVSPLGIKVKDRFIEFASPGTWPQLGISGNDGHDWKAGLIDTAELLKANGFAPDTPFNIVVGGAELDTGNTYRIQGNHDSLLHTANSSRKDDEYSVEYGNIPGENGIWRTLTFSNYHLSHGFAPSLRRHLSGPATKPDDIQAHHQADATSPARDAAGDGLSGNATPGDSRLYTDIKHPDPDIRAKGLTKLVTRHQRDRWRVVPAITEGLRDPNVHVRETSLGTLETWEGPLPEKALTEVALKDESTPLRVHALDLLAYRKGIDALEVLQQARLDPVPMVSQFAEQLITEIRHKSNTQPTPGGEQQQIP